MGLTNEISRQTAIKAAIVSTTNTAGWRYIKEVADKLVAEAIQGALDEEDSALGESKRLKAKALQKGFADLFQSITSIAQYSPTAVDDNAFGELELPETERELSNQ